MKAKRRALALLLPLACGQAPDRSSPEPRGPASLAFAGDAMLGRGIAAQFAQDPSFSLWRGTADALAGVDGLAFNLETTITTHDETWDGKNYHFRLPPHLARSAFDAILRDNNVPSMFASIANNHALDFHVPGLVDTIENLESLGVPFAGSGRDVEAARAPAIAETASGVRVAYFAASTVCSCGDLSEWAADAASPGSWMIAAGDDDAWADAAARVRAVSAEVDYVVFSLHWGLNYIAQWPVAWMRTRARQLANAGVDVIVGHSAHHVLPVEHFGETIVLYGTGDFIDDYAPEAGFRNDLSFIGRVELTPGAAPALEVIPLRLEHAPEHFGWALAADDPDYRAVMAATEGR